MIRSAPSRKPRYQSGTEPALMLPGWFGPISHTGLIWATTPSRVSVAPVNGSSGSTRRTRAARGRPPVVRIRAYQALRAGST
jgi:hypothetical protein